MSLTNENRRLRKQNRQLQRELMPFREECFQWLSSREIAELAKESIKLRNRVSELESENGLLQEQIISQKEYSR